MRTTSRHPSFWAAVWLVWVILAAIRALAVGLGSGRPIHGPLVGLRPTPIALDRARLDELALLPGLGPVRAEALVLDRVRHGPVPDIAALARIPGVGPVTVERLRPFVVLRGQVPGRTGATD